MLPPAEFMAPDPGQTLISLLYLLASLSGVTLGAGLLLGLVAGRWGPALGALFPLAFLLAGGMASQVTVGLVQYRMVTALACLLPLGALGGWLGCLLSPRPQPGTDH